MFIDPIIIQWLLLAAASGCAFMIGIVWSDNRKEEIIENTIIYLLENNFVKGKKVDGEIELLRLDEIDNS
jgi:hypothetical protein